MNPDERHWQIQAATGFLIQPQPLEQLGECLSSLSADCIAELEHFSKRLHEPQELSKLSLYDFSAFQAEDGRVLERLMMLYGYFASAWIHSHLQKSLAASIAIPLSQIAAQVGRPPMLAYANMVLTNWKLKNPEEGFTPKNVEVLQTFSSLIDEAWFFRVHIAIEGQAGAILTALLAADTAAQADDEMGVLIALRQVRAGLVEITQTFHEMPNLCDPDIYYQQVRPYLFGFEGVPFEGVPDAPTSLRGGSGAQSSIVPTVLAAMGIHHERTELTMHLQTMRPYMPRAHQAFMEQMKALKIRDYCALHPPLRDAYNHALHQLITFRRAHLYYARTYIFAKSTNPVGTGGTEYLSFLSRLIEETTEHLLS